MPEKTDAELRAHYDGFATPLLSRLVKRWTAERAAQRAAGVDDRFAARQIEAITAVLWARSTEALSDRPTVPDREDDPTP